MNTIRKSLLTAFCKDACFYWIRFSTVGEEEFGKILSQEELKSIDTMENEIHRSIKNKNDDKLFVIDLKPSEEQLVDNPLELLTKNLEDAEAIELVYPKIFLWCFDGLNIKGYAIVPSGDPIAHSTISRYGGTDNFIKILKRHLDNIAKMRRGTSPNYEFFNIRHEIKDTEISVGSINKKTGLYSIIIDLNMTWIRILRQSKKCISIKPEFRRLDIKYWAREINPDFISEAKHIRLNNVLEIGNTDIERKNIFDLYPAPIKRIMGLKNKGNLNRYLIARFLLSVHSQKDAKFMYHSILGEEELEHVKSGNCKTQWTYIINNLERYNCPSMKELENFIEVGDEKLSHPLEKIQKYLENRKREEKYI